ncbi:unnamed protein product [Coffea canephora]|uniref:Uncharacterized protein n=1 Tax=Coffea canephora TaxID=49390 RepID=A0A068UHG6_COFCA|nr:unnamed protein product [Coffea canephora]
MGQKDIVVRNTKKVLVGAGAWALFNPTLLYNVVRNKVQVEFWWWDWIDEFVLFAAVPFRSDVSQLKDLGVGAVVTLNEPYETLVPTSLSQVCSLPLFLTCFFPLLCVCQGVSALKSSLVLLVLLIFSSEWLMEFIILVFLHEITSLHHHSMIFAELYILFMVTLVSIVRLVKVTAQPSLFDNVTFLVNADYLYSYFSSPLCLVFCILG